jgi:hypothetical protein
MSKQSTITYVSEFVGGFPDIPVPADVDISQLERDGESPFWVTLPIVPDIGVVSGNGLLYDDDLAASIEEQINSKRPGGNFGHLAEALRDTAFPHPKAFWVAAKRVGQTLWAKCYVPAGEAREHLRNLKAVGGRIATSIFGRGDFEKVSKGVQRLVNFQLETVDFAPPERAALGYAAPVMVTAEMTEHEEEINMPGEAVIEMAQVSETLKAQIIAEYEKQSGAARQVAELTQERDAAVAELTIVREQVRQREVVEVRRSIKDHVAKLSGWQVSDPKAKLDVEALRRTVVEFAESKVGDSTDLVHAQRTVDGLWVQFAPLAEALRDKLAGPAAVVSGRVQETRGFKPVEDTPENRAAAASKMGIVV